MLGKVKTRLAKGIGNEKALELYKILLKNTLNVASKGHWDVQIHLSEKAEGPWLDHLDVFIQKGNTLGDRMSNSLKIGFETYEKVLLVGADIPLLSEAIIVDGFQKLDKCDLVWGPAEDGGYYLVGMSRWTPQVFQLKNWSHPLVLSDSLTIAQQHRLSSDFTTNLNDLDTLEDLKKFPKYYNFLPR